MAIDPARPECSDDDHPSRLGLHPAQACQRHSETLRVVCRKNQKWTRFLILIAAILAALAVVHAFVGCSQREIQNLQGASQAGQSGAVVGGSVAGPVGGAVGYVLAAAAYLLMHREKKKAKNLDAMLTHARGQIDAMAKTSRSEASTDSFPTIQTATNGLTPKDT